MSRRQHGLHRVIGSVLLAITAIAQPLLAQPRRLPAPVIGQIVDEVLSHVIPPDSSLSRMPIRERGIYFDYGRTLAAFGYRDDSMTRAALALKSVVMPGTDSLLGDCSQASAKPCDRLGQHAYAYVTPRSRSNGAMVVLLHVAWPDRGGARYARAPAPSETPPEAGRRESRQRDSHDNISVFPGADRRARGLQQDEGSGQPSD